MASAAKTKNETKARKSKLVGEDAADYKRTHIPQGRWADTWDLFKNCFVKLIIINVFVLLFCVPSIVIVYIGKVYTASLGSLYPFSANVGLGYFAYPGTAGLSESVYLTSDLMFYSLLALSSLIASVGFAGAFYSIRRIINTHGDFTVKGFFRGVKQCYFNVVFPVFLFMVFFFGCVVVKDWVAYNIAIGGNKAGSITAEVFMIIATVIVGFFCAWVIAVGISFKAKFKYLIKNTFVLMTGSIIPSIFMAAFSLIPIWLFWWGVSSTIVKIISYVIFIFIGFSFIILCWMAFAQWTFDTYITPAIKNEKEAEKAKKTPKQIADEEAEQRKQVALELLASGRSELIGKPIMPISEERAVKPVGKAYCRADLTRVAAERNDLKETVEKYAGEHINDPKYAVYNKLFQDREKALQEKDKKAAKKKKISSDNLLK